LDAVAASRASEDSPHLVAIKPDGSRLPLFCIHAIGGNVLNYRVLAPALHREQPLYGLQATGIDGIARPLASIEAMALAYRRAIKTLQPVGPYLLGGGSLGGMIALEIAQQLLRDGDAVRLLVMFDTVGPNAYARSSSPVGWVGQRLAGQASPKALASAVWRGIRSRGVDLGRLLRCRASQLRGMPIGHELRYWYVTRAHLAAIRKYRPRPYGGRIHLIRGSLEQTGPLSDPERGWSGWAKGGLAVSIVEGQHGSFVETAELHERLRDLLDEMNA
jgi:thioesterase domain-containing protein